MIFFLISLFIIGLFTVGWCAWTMEMERISVAAARHLAPKWGGEVAEDWMCRIWCAELARHIRPHVNTDKEYWGWGHLGEVFKEAHPEWFRGKNNFQHYDEIFKPVYELIRNHEVENCRPQLEGYLNTLKHLIEEEHPDKLRFITIDVYDIVRAIHLVRTIEDKRRALRDYEKQSSIKYYHGILYDGRYIPKR